MKRSADDKIYMTIKLLINADLVANRQDHKVLDKSIPCSKQSNCPLNSFIDAFLSFLSPWFTNLPKWPDSSEASMLNKNKYRQ